MYIECASNIRAAYRGYPTINRTSQVAHVDQSIHLDNTELTIVDKM